MKWSIFGQKIAGPGALASDKIASSANSTYAKPPEGWRIIKTSATLGLFDL